MALTTSSVIFYNLPETVDDDSMRIGLVENFPEFFAEAYQKGELDVKVFRRTGSFTTGEDEVAAVVSGASVVLRDLHRAATGKRLYGKLLLVKYDLGLARDVTGEFVNSYCSIDQRRLKAIRSCNVRRCLLHLQPSVKDELNGSFYNSRFTNLHPQSSVNAEVIGAIQVGGRLKTVQFDSALECLQAIVAYNMTTVGSIVPGNPVIFCSKTGKLCTLKLQKGLGAYGSILELKEIQKCFGYIPFEFINPTIVDLQMMRSMMGKCIKCQGRFWAIGIDIDCMFIATRCENCTYDSGSNFTEPGKAFCWTNESFTRHTDKLSNAYKPFRIDVLYKPMKFMYEDANDFRSVVERMAYWEWQQSILNHMRQNTSGSLIRVEKIGQGREHLIQIRVMRTPLWRQSNYSKIGGLKLSFLANKNNLEMTTLKVVTAFWIEDDLISNTCVITTTVEIEEMMKIPESQIIHLVPLPDKSTFNAVTNYLVNWTSGILENKWENLILAPIRNCAQDIMSIPLIASLEYFDAYNRIIGGLNPEQLQAVENALYYPASLLNGGPGTGKSLTCAVIAVSLAARLPNEKVVLVAPTTEACDTLCQQINQILQKYFDSYPKFSVLRVYSKKEEISFMMSSKTPTLGQHILALNHLVEEIIMTEGDMELQEFLNHIKCGGYFRLPNKSKWDEAVDYYEQMVLQNCTTNIIVTTTSALLDSRFKDVNDFNRLTIDTLIIDTAELVSETHGLPYLGYGQNRLVLSGDDRQAKTTVFHQTAEAAGYDMPMIEWLRLARCNLPSSTLKLQYRMYPALANFVSDLAYTDMPLLTHESLSDRKWTEFSPLVLVDHHGKDVKVGTGFINHTEALLVSNYCRFLLQRNISPDRISVATFYQEQRDLIAERIVPMGIKPVVWESMVGRENDFCIISAVRSEEAHVAFDRNFARYVMLTSRAKLSCVVMTNRSCLLKNNMASANKFLNLMKRYGDIIKVNDLSL